MKQKKLSLRRRIELARNSIERLEKFVKMGAPKKVLKRETNQLLRLAWSLWWQVRRRR